MDDPESQKAADALFTRLEADRVRVAAATPLPYSEALEHCRAWILGRGATTRSAEVLRSLLLSLANEGRTELSEIRALDVERRLWFITLILHLDKLNDSELRYAAGIEYGEES